MSNAKSWLLPDGMDELLPERAAAAEALRLDLLASYKSWGYQLVKPPLVEFLDSLKVGTGQDLALKTFTLTDQLSGRLLGIRADLTPQVARIDAHSLKRKGPVRLCYCAPVLHSTPAQLSDTRQLDQIGIELFGSDSINADLEVLQLMLTTIETAGGLHNPKTLKLDLGHVAIFRAIANFAGLDKDSETKLSKIIQRKAMLDLEEFISDKVANDEAASLIRILPSLCGAYSVLAKAKVIFEKVSDQSVVEKLLSALEDLQTVTRNLQSTFPKVECYFDLGEVRGYDYHTGLMFAVYKEGYAKSLAKGGRYNSIGECFGRSRPATGFSCDLRKLLSLAKEKTSAESIAFDGIFVPLVSASNNNDDAALKKKISELRKEGKVLIQSLGNDELTLKDERCFAELALENGEWQVRSL